MGAVRSDAASGRPARMMAVPAVGKTVVARTGIAEDTYAERNSGDSFGCSSEPALVVAGVPQHLGLDATAEECMPRDVD